MDKAQPANTLKDNAGRGILFVLFAYLLFSFVDTSTKWLLGAGLAVLQLAFMRYFTHFAITLAEASARRGRPARQSLRIKGLVLLRSFSLVSATIANFFALGHLPLAVTSAILFASPVIVCLLARFILNERLTARRLLAVALGLLGVLVILNPFGQDINWYAVLMLYPATGMALYVVLTRLLAGQVSPQAMQMTTGALGTIVLLPVAILTWQNPQTPLDWALLFLIGAFAWAGHEVLTRAHAYAEASFLAPFSYIFIIYLTLLGWLIFGDVPGWNTALGSVLIFVSALTLQRNSAPKPLP